MKNSLKSELHKMIQSKGYCSYNEVVEKCRQLNYKISNGERRLRSSESPQIQTIYGDKGYITGYKFIESGQLSFV